MFDGFWDFQLFLKQIELDFKPILVSVTRKLNCSGRLVIGDANKMRKTTFYHRFFSSYRAR